MARVTCLRCGSGRTADGSLHSMDDLAIHFQAGKKVKWWHTPVMREVRARLCADCGSISLHADFSNLKVVKK